MIGTFWISGYRSDSIFIGLINNSTGAMFPLFPWTGYLLLGGVMGVLGSHPTRGRLQLVIGLAVMTALTLALAMTPADRWPWRPFAELKLDTYLVSNACERIWKLGVICLTLMAVEKVTTLVAAAARVLKPASAVLEYFSSKALSGYFAHLTLLYGFLGIQITQVWHRKSSWGQYWWRLGVMYCLTALVCYGLHRARRGIEAMIRNARGVPATAATAGAA
jgi:uncharacterized membrane protein